MKRYGVGVMNANTFYSLSALCIEHYLCICALQTEHYVAASDIETGVKKISYNGSEPKNTGVVYLIW